MQKNEIFFIWGDTWCRRTIISQKIPLKSEASEGNPVAIPPERANVGGTIQLSDSKPRFAEITATAPLSQSINLFHNKRSNRLLIYCLAPVTNVFWNPTRNKWSKFDVLRCIWIRWRHKMMLFKSWEVVAAQRLENRPPISMSCRLPVFFLFSLVLTFLLFFIIKQNAQSQVPHVRAAHWLECQFTNLEVMSSDPDGGWPFLFCFYYFLSNFPP